MAESLAIPERARDRLIDIQDQIEDAHMALRFIAQVAAAGGDLQDEMDEGEGVSEAEKHERTAGAIRCVAHSLKAAFDQIDPLARDYENKGFRLREQQTEGEDNGQA